MKTAFLRATAALTLLFVLASNGSAVACAACYGDTTGSKMGNAAAVGIFAMVVIMFVMLGTLLAFGFYFAHRAKQTYPDYDELLADDSLPPTPNPGTSS
jgi:ABC-type Fe3+ transport system permease subunit